MGNNSVRRDDRTGAIIGAGSIVAKDVPPYAIYVGSQVIKYRFPPPND